MRNTSTLTVRTQAVANENAAGSNNGPQSPAPRPTPSRGVANFRQSITRRTIAMGIAALLLLALVLNYGHGPAVLSSDGNLFQGLRVTVGPRDFSPAFADADRSDASAGTSSVLAGRGVIFGMWDFPGAGREVKNLERFFKTLRRSETFGTHRRPLDCPLRSNESSSSASSSARLKPALLPADVIVFTSEVEEPLRNVCVKYGVMLVTYSHGWVSKLGLFSFSSVRFALSNILMSTTIGDLDGLQWSSPSNALKRATPLASWRRWKYAMTSDVNDVLFQRDPFATALEMVSENGPKRSADVPPYTQERAGEPAIGLAPRRLTSLGGAGNRPKCTAGHDEDAIRSSKLAPNGPFILAALEVDENRVVDGNINAYWVQKCLGKSALDEVRGATVSCSGTTIGDLASMQQYTLRMDQVMRTHVLCGVQGIDQGVHNYLVRRDPTVAPRVLFTVAEFGRAYVTFDRIATVVFDDRTGQVLEGCSGIGRTEKGGYEASIARRQASLQAAQVAGPRQALRQPVAVVHQINRCNKFAKHFAYRRAPKITADSPDDAAVSVQLVQRGEGVQGWNCTTLTNPPDSWWDPI